MFRINKADMVCLALLLCGDISVAAWLGNKHASVLNYEAQTGLLGENLVAPDVLLSPTQHARAKSPPREDSDIDNELWEHTYGDYTVKTVRSRNSDGDTVLHIYQAGKLVTSLSSHVFYDPEDEAAEEGNSNVPRPDTDITGDGRPNLVIADWSGGPHCCTTYHIYELGEELRLVATIEGHDGGASFVDADGDGFPEIQLRDWSYAYVFTSYAGMAVPDVVLKYEDGRYVVAPNLMFTTEPTEEEYSQQVQEVRDVYAKPPDGEIKVSSPGVWGSDATLWGKMLELTYTGHVDLALKLFDTCWQAEWEDKDAAADQFWKKVGESLYGRAVVEAQGYEFPEPEPESTTPPNDD